MEWAMGKKANTKTNRKQGINSETANIFSRLKREICIINNGLTSK
jgi:hypothetical protein